jgi:DNA repair protein RecO (recombination protein O)
MEWHDEGIILGTRRHGEASAIVEVMTSAHGRHLGLVRGGRSRRMQPMLQSGNRVELVWRARLDEHLGNFQIEPLVFSAAGLMETPLGLNGLQLAASHLRLLPERDPHPGLYDMLLLILGHLDDPMTAGELLARFEVMMLEELGFGIDLKACALTGSHDDLAYVSPKSGRAVCRAAAAQWADRLLPLPGFLQAPAGRARSVADIAAAFRLTGHFLARHVWDARGLTPPEARAGFIAIVTRHGGISVSPDGAMAS